MSDISFFDESREQSQIKAEIVAKYFWAWAKVIIPSAKRRGNKIAYIDLFAGPGRYEDGKKSTPLLILERAIQDPDMREMLVTLFNDLDSNKTQALQKAIEAIPGIANLKYKPLVYNNEVGSEIVELFEQMHLIPTLFFVDPFGYKGLSLRLINSVLKDWGCDCIFFFNYNRINMGLSNPCVIEHMNALFSESRANELRLRLEGLDSFEREMSIVNELALALQDYGSRYVLPFCFKNELGKRTSHHLIFVSKHIRGYEIMKEIMAKYSSNLNQGVPSFMYNPAPSTRQLLLFELAGPLDDLADMLVRDFAGKNVKMEQVYSTHHVGKRYIKKNYKDALMQLEAEQKIITNPPADQRPKGTFGDNVLVIFPSGNISLN